MLFRRWGARVAAAALAGLVASAAALAQPGSSSAMPGGQLSDWADEAAADDLDSTAMEDEAVEVLGMEVVDSLEYSGYVEGAEHHHFRPASQQPEAATARAVIRSCGCPSLEVPRLVGLHRFIDSLAQLFSTLTIDYGCAKAQGAGDWFPEGWGWSDGGKGASRRSQRDGGATATFYNLHGSEVGSGPVPLAGMTEDDIAALLERHGLRRRAVASEARGAEEEMSVRGMITTEADDDLGMSADDWRPENEDDIFNIDFSDSASPLDH